jgi:transposase InsO family protein
VTMVDIKTKAIKLEPADITITARAAAVVMKNRVFQEEGLPVKVISDRGPQFIRRFMKELYAMLGIEGNPSTAYHLQTDGQTKRTNWEVEKYLRMFTNHQQDDWVDWLPLVEFTYNNAVHEATGQTPFFLNKGRHPRTLESDPLSEAETSAEEFLQNIKNATKSAEES